MVALTDCSSTLHTQPVDFTLIKYKLFALFIAVLLIKKNIDINFLFNSDLLRYYLHSLPFFGQTPTLMPPTSQYARRTYEMFCVLSLPYNCLSRAVCNQCGRQNYLLYVESLMLL